MRRGEGIVFEEGCSEEGVAEVIVFEEGCSEEGCSEEGCSEGIVSGMAEGAVSVVTSSERM